jgi:hypothetical protein
MGMAWIRWAGMYRRFGSTAPRLKVISPGRYPDLSGPPYTSASNRATPAMVTATEPSHHRSAAAGTARSLQAAATATTAQPSTTMSV